MNIPVKNCHAIVPDPVPCVSRSNCNVVEKTKSHGTIALRMMAGRTHGTEDRIAFVLCDSLNSGNHGSRRQQGCVKRALGSKRVTLVKQSPTTCTDPFHRPDLRLAVDAQEILNLRGPRGNMSRLPPEFTLPEMHHQPFKTLWPLRMARRRAML